METTIRPPVDSVEIIRTYLELTKLRIVLLLLFTTVTAMVIAANGIPDLIILIPTIIGGALAPAGAGAINQYIDRDMDAKMTRTARRPIPSGRVAPVNALLFGIVLVAVSVLILGAWVNWTAAGLALLGAVYYTIIYTVMLKRNTATNIVIGGGAGAIPVLVGWAAVTGSLSVEAWLLFMIVFYWTPLGVGAVGECRLCPCGCAHDAGGTWRTLDAMANFALLDFAIRHYTATDCH
jgi:protoheme IX farnesyltransferase